MFSFVALTTLLVAQLGNAPAGDAAAVSLPVLIAPGGSPVNSEGQVVFMTPALLASADVPLPCPPKAHVDPNVVPAAAWTEYSETDAEINPQQSEYLTRDQVRAEVKKLAWTKGDFKIVPYGTLWGNMAFDTQRAKTGEYCLWIESESTHFDESDAAVDARSSRIGFDLAGPCIPCLGDAKVGGKVEIDFQGYFLTRNKPGLMLRHAYMEAKDDNFRLLIGQTWDVISPLGIPTLNYTAGSAVGNLAYRRAQFRFERYYNLSDTERITLQTSANANVVTDFVGETGTSADPGPYPDFQARAAITLGPRSGCEVPPIEIGIGGHGGEQNFDFRSEANPLLDVERQTWSVCADAYVPITARFGFQGEFFHGENLSNYMGGILQGVDRVTHRGIHATGGWVDVWYKWRPNLCSHSGYALDDPANGDLTSGRTYNQMIFNNLLYDATANLQLGVEADVWTTHYMGLKPGEAVRIECAAKYRF